MAADTVAERIATLHTSDDIAAARLALMEWSEALDQVKDAITARAVLLDLEHPDP
ncbi:hypothetical protein [Actinomadura nitritigenes]|uniref:hypothetical protein n=1 Tax=Actinomadura nitritigenes TaxID=134602 RepID=UPI003D9089A0